ncbi:MAG: hypothetical protein ACXQTH_03985 [Dehalococcoidia bacterium]
MALDRLDVDCVTDPVGKLVGEDSRVDKKDKEQGPGAGKADARNDIRHAGPIQLKYKFSV